MSLIQFLRLLLLFSFYLSRCLLCFYWSLSLSVSVCALFNLFNGSKGLYYFLFISLSLVLIANFLFVFYASSGLCRFVCHCVCPFQSLFCASKGFYFYSFISLFFVHTSNFLSSMLLQVSAALSITVYALFNLSFVLLRACTFFLSISLSFVRIAKLLRLISTS